MAGLTQWCRQQYPELWGEGLREVVAGTGADDTWTVNHFRYVNMGEGAVGL